MVQSCVCVCVCVLDGDDRPRSHRDAGVIEGKDQDPLVGLQEKYESESSNEEGLLESWAPSAHNNQEVNKTEGD